LQKKNILLNQLSLSLD